MSHFTTTGTRPDRPQVKLGADAGLNVRGT